MEVVLGVGVASIVLYAITRLGIRDMLDVGELICQRDMASGLGVFISATVALVRILLIVWYTRQWQRLVHREIGRRCRHWPVMYVLYFIEC
ncbi:hypothetical protein BDQ12DRAFT_680743 [Crucibulum laeve]|uniref:Uncharacterized protein n=1 Tax=Crucibulum laeve TaxID=68775 RepID=A0A5C3MGN9_9AGAR|nr:hypothetical protein BDQ12DRAFT_680743 [Crucibulum laeve]